MVKFLNSAIQIVSHRVAGRQQQTTINFLFFFLPCGTFFYHEKCCAESASTNCLACNLVRRTHTFQQIALWFLYQRIVWLNLFSNFSIKPFPGHTIVGKRTLHNFIRLPLRQRSLCFPQDSDVRLPRRRLKNACSKKSGGFGEVNTSTFLQWRQQKYTQATAQHECPLECQ